MRCVVFGATGYIGGRLVPALLAAGHQLRAVARNPGKLAEVPWRDRVEIVNGDVTDAQSTRDAMAGQDVVYYLVHSLNRRDFVDVDRRAAHVLAEAARSAGMARLVYLGGITPDTQHLSDHLASRAEVGQILLDSGVPTIVLRAAVILGPGRPASRCCATSPSGSRRWSHRAGCTTASSPSRSATCCTT